MKRILRVLGVIIVGITIVASWIFFYLFVKIFYLDTVPEEIAVQSVDEGERGFLRDECNIAGINLHGELATYAPISATAEGDLYSNDDITGSEDIILAIRAAERAENIQAILLDVDSPGGGPVAGQEVMNVLKSSEKPTIAVIRERGLSAAYWAATGADVIFASSISDVGGIGVTGSYLQNVRFNQKEGYEYIDLSTGKFKDTGNPDRTLTEEERTLIMRDIQKIHDVFVKTVAENRKLKVEQVAALADGSSILGDEALRKGLIDYIGSYTEAKEYLKKQFGKQGLICW